jgi:hypothetical protein
VILIVTSDWVPCHQKTTLRQLGTAATFTWHPIEIPEKPQSPSQLRGPFFLAALASNTSGGWKINEATGAMEMHPVKSQQISAYTGTTIQFRDNNLCAC